MVPGCRSISIFSPGAIFRQSAIFTSETVPGAIGAVTVVAFGPGSPASRTYSPHSSSIDTGASLDPIEERPMLAGSARVRNIAWRELVSQTALAPMNICFVTATSTSAVSRSSSSINISIRFERRQTSPRSSAPEARAPAAMPARVPSMFDGNTLFVPVEIGTSGTSPQPLATTRFVPSPPSVTMQSTPCSAIVRAAFVEAPWWSATGIST